MMPIRQMVECFAGEKPSFINGGFYGCETPPKHFPAAVFRKVFRGCFALFHRCFVMFRFLRFRMRNTRNTSLKDVFGFRRRSLFRALQPARSDRRTQP
jgi:hypothetical protein